MGAGKDRKNVPRFLGENKKSVRTLGATRGESTTTKGQKKLHRSEKKRVTGQKDFKEGSLRMTSGGKSPLEKEKAQGKGKVGKKKTGDQSKNLASGFKGALSTLKALKKGEDKREGKKRGERTGSIALYQDSGQETEMEKGRELRNQAKSIQGRTEEGDRRREVREPPFRTVHFETDYAPEGHIWGKRSAQNEEKVTWPPMPRISQSKEGQRDDNGVVLEGLPAERTGHPTSVRRTLLLRGGGKQKKKGVTTIEVSLTDNGLTQRMERGSISKKSAEKKTIQWALLAA